LASSSLQRCDELRQCGSPLRNRFKSPGEGGQRNALYIQLPAEELGYLLPSGPRRTGREPIEILVPVVLLFAAGLEWLAASEKVEQQESELVDVG
jgi:hypothetical protein